MAQRAKCRGLRRERAMDVDVSIMFFVGLVIFVIASVGGVAFFIGESKLSDGVPRNFDNWGNQ